MYDTDVRFGRALAVVFALALNACGSDQSEKPRQRDRGQGAEKLRSCAQEEADVASAFRPLPRGFEYQLIDDAAELKPAKGFSVIAGRTVLRRRRTAGAVVAQVSSTPITDEAEHLRGMVAALEADDPAKSVRMNGRDVQHVTAPSGTYYLSISGGCTELLVLGADATVAEQVARAVIR